jgi:hypothetical protein
MRALGTTSLAAVLVTAALIDRSRAVAFSAPTAADAQNADYEVAVQASQSGGGRSWKYTIAKTSADAKDLDDIVVHFGTCGGESPAVGSIVAATINGVNWLDRVAATQGPTGAVSPHFVKFDRLPAADTHVLEFTLDGVYAVMDTTAWLNSGALQVTKAVPGPGCRGYLRTSAMEADPSLVRKAYTDINNYMRRFGFDYTEHPHCTGGYGGHGDGVHGDVDHDQYFDKLVFRFDIHINPVIDGDRCSASTIDRQRNEMKSITNNSEWAKVQGNWDEWQMLEWKFKLPRGLQPTANFFHVHQLKAQDGPNIDSPTITITPRATSAGLNKRIQVIHSVDGVPTGKGTIVDNVPLSEFEDEWVQVREEIHYRHDGYYSLKITRIRDGSVLIDFTDDDIDMWRVGSSYIRSKFGLYRSLAGGQLNRTPVGLSPLLKNESLWLTDVRVYEKDPNPTPGVPHD